MLVRHEGHLEYLTMVEAIAADAWLVTFRLNHHEEITSGDQSTGIIFPPGSENVTGYLNFELHYDVPTQEDVDALVDELEAAILNGGIVTARGDSTTGTTLE